MHKGLKNMIKKHGSVDLKNVFIRSYPIAFKTDLLTSKLILETHQVKVFDCPTMVRSWELDRKGKSYV
jgi:hypothetical protein